jgi:2-octaprenyl-6-methoxy-1,4-benzoquinone methylase (EC 2.1.1.-)/demethylmenaquinone methyltransferase (EC 2.1.1.-)
MDKDNSGYTDFGYERVSIGDKARRVGAVFSSVAGRYDLMNDLMSFGVHRIWKRFAIDLAGVRPGERVLDLAGGTGDLAAKFARQVRGVGGDDDGMVVLADINAEMLGAGRHRLDDAGLLEVPLTRLDAQRLPFPDASFDCVTIGFGLRNVTDKDAALREMARILRPAAGAGAGILQAAAGTAGGGLRSVFLQGAAAARPAGGRRRRQLPLPRRVDPHASGSGDAGADDGNRRAGARPVLQPHRRHRRRPSRLPSRMTPAPALACAALEIALNRYLRLDDGALADCAQLRGRPIAFAVEDLGWEWVVEPHASGVRVSGSGAAEVRVQASSWRLLRAGLEALRGGRLAADLPVSGDAELLQRFVRLLARVGFEPEEWLAPLLGGAAAHRVAGGLDALLGWARRSGDSLGYSAAEFLREETEDLARADDVAEWMAEVDTLREDVDRLEARLRRIEHINKPGASS